MDDSNRDTPAHPEPDPQEPNPLEQMLNAFLGPEAAAEAARQMEMQGFSPSTFMGAITNNGDANISLNQIRYLFSSNTGPINWQMVEDMAKQQAYQSGDPALNDTQVSQVRQAMTIGDLWLDPITDFASKSTTRQAWTRVSWVENTLPAWKGICEPVAANVARALSDALGEEINKSSEYGGLPPELAQLTGSITAAIPRMSSMMFSGQVGQALSALSQESFGSSDSGLPLGDPSTTALVLSNIEAFSEGLEIPADEVLQFLAVREAAHARLFSSVPWLKTDLLQAVQLYAQEIAIDTDAIAETARSFNPEDLESVQQISIDGLFATSPTEAQQRALQRLETMLALIEGWVETITAQAVAPYLPHANQLQEMLRRRRVSGAPGEQLLAQLVGLHLRPRSARDAARLFQSVQNEQGPEARDALWAHPDMIPTADEISAPDSFIANRAAQKESSDEIDQALEQLLSGTLGWADGLKPEDNGSEPPDDNDTKE